MNLKCKVRELNDKTDGRYKRKLNETENELINKVFKNS